MIHSSLPENDPVKKAIPLSSWLSTNIRYLMNGPKHIDTTKIYISCLRASASYDIINRYRSLYCFLQYTYLYTVYNILYNIEYT